MNGTPKERRERWEQEVGPLYRCKVIRPVCGNPKCVLPEHCEIEDRRKNPYRKYRGT